MNQEKLEFTRCKRCNVKPRGKMAERNFAHYHPFCSYGCQQWYDLEEARRYLATLREEQ